MFSQLREREREKRERERERETERERQREREERERERTENTPILMAHTVITVFEVVFNEQHSRS